MNPKPLLLKNSKGWFAAGAEIENALKRSTLRLKVGQKRRRSSMPGAMDMSR